MHSAALTMPPSVEKQLYSLSEEVARLRGLLGRVYLTTKEVQQRYRWSPRTFYYKRRAPGFPAPKRFPGHVWPLAELEAAEAAGQLPDPV